MHTATIYTPRPHRAEPLLLVQELSHRVINEYSQAIAGIRQAARGLASCEAQAALASVAIRLLSFAEAHRALQVPALSGNVDLADTLDRLCGTISASRLQEGGVSLILAPESLDLSADRCWRVALIVSELITNSIRHGLQGGPGLIRVDMEVGEHSTICRVVDDGCGKVPVSPGRGFDVVTVLAAEIGGAIVWCFSAKGTSAELSFPNLDTGHNS